MAVSPLRNLDFQMFAKYLLKDAHHRQFTIAQCIFYEELNAQSLWIKSTEETDANYPDLVSTPYMRVLESHGISHNDV